jgi:hypothetical protein
MIFLIGLHTKIRSKIFYGYLMILDNILKVGVIKGKLHVELHKIYFSVIIND